MSAQHHRRPQRPWGALPLLWALAGALPAAEGPAPAELRAQEVEIALQACDQALASGDLGLARSAAEQLRQRAPGDRRVLQRLLLVHDLEERQQRRQHSEDLATVGQQLDVLELRASLRRAEEAIEAGEWDRAQEATDQARALAASRPLTEASSSVAIEGLSDRIAAVRRQRATAERQAARQAALTAARAARATEVAGEQAGRDERIERILAVAQRGHLELALNQARALQREMPAEVRVQALYDRLLARVHEQRRLDLAERRIELRKEVERRVHDALIPTGLDRRPEFPSDWAERDVRKLPAVGTSTALPDWHEQILDRLAARVAIEYDAVDAIEALEMLGRRLGLNLVVDPALRAAPPAPVTLRLVDISGGAALDLLTTGAGVGWQVRDQAVWVGPKNATMAVTRIYDVAFAAHPPPNFTAATSNFNISENGGDTNLNFGQENDAGNNTSSPEELVDLLRRTVSPEIWQEPTNQVTLRGERTLIVTAPATTHELIRRYLASQFQANRTLVNLELRFLRLNDDYAEEIGVDWTNAPFLSALPIRGGYQQSWSTRTAVASVVNQLPGVAATLAPDLATNGLTLQMAHLGASQVSAMIRAAEMRRRGQVLSGVELTCVNGQRANAVFSRQTSYVAGYDSQDGILEPRIETINAGTVLSVQPMVSADRKYVTLEVRPTFTTLSFTIDVIRTLNVVGTVADEDGDFDVYAPAAYPIELPNIELTSAGTRVNVPDQGTILVGGMTQALDQTADAKVPVLGNIPFLGRLFGKRGRYSDRSRIYLMMTARIVLYDEEEERL